jgi:hypothetical protein
MSASSIKKCEDKFCNEYYKQVKKITQKVINLTLQKVKNKDLSETQKKKIHSGVKKIKNKLESQKFKKDTMKQCKISFCNPTCKGTIFQNNKFPNELINKYKKEKKSGEMALKYLKNMRKDLFKGKKTVLKNGFYEKLHGINKLKKKGAISGCAVMTLME